MQTTHYRRPYKVTKDYFTKILKAFEALETFEALEPFEALVLLEALHHFETYHENSISFPILVLYFIVLEPKFEVKT